MLGDIGRFLPEDFSESGARVMLIAGRGEYPLFLAQRILERGIRCGVIGIQGEASPRVLEKFPQGDRNEVQVGQLGKVLRILKRFRASDVILAGQIQPLRLFRDLHLDWRALCLIRRLKKRNAHTIFSTVCEQITQWGMRVLDGRSFMDADITQRSTQFPLKRWIVEHGIYIASEIARLDIGQSVIVRNGTVLSVEGFDGTDAMIRHAQSLNTKNMLLVKISKPHHDFRFDVPIFGMQTLELMSRSGIRFAALEANRVIILNRDLVLKRAEELNIKIFGY
ncbi:MAG: UDP-2,3-diacylglucosamine diphosphatase LpxI [Puniceicoccales bacterium]|jgi:DUF1009 family protein|nr:UDP-2,3-diacylglucosamine diphosphatase LpxI [Puniceicoccales bacterium]